MSDSSINLFATFSDKVKFAHPLNYEIVNALNNLDVSPYILKIVSETTTPIIRPSGAAVLYNHEDVSKRLGGWPDMRLQSLYNPQFEGLGLYRSGFDPNLPLSGMTVMLIDPESNEPVLVGNLILESPLSLAHSLYIVREDKNQFTVKNTFNALNIEQDTFAIIPGYAYILPARRLGNKDGKKGLKNIMDFIKIGKTAVTTLNKCLKSLGINAVIISQQDSTLANLVEELPDFSKLVEGHNIDLDEKDPITGNPRWLVSMKGSGIIKNVFNEDFFGVPGDEARATAGLAKRSDMKQLTNIAHIVDNQLGPVYLGLNPDHFMQDFKGIIDKEI